MKDPRFRQVRFNTNLTIVQKALLGRMAKERGCSKSELIREMVHFYLRERGIDDELIYDEEDFSRHYDQYRRERHEDPPSNEKE